MPTPSSNFPSPNAASAKRKSYLPQLFLGVSVTTVVFLFGLVVRRLVQLPRTDHPAATHRLAHAQHPAAPHPIVFGLERAESKECIIPLSPALAKADEAQPTLDQEPKEPAPVPPRPVQRLTADQIVEQRLCAGEEELRSALRGVPEVQLLSDSAFKQTREAERTAQRSLIVNARAARLAAYRSAGSNRQAAAAALSPNVPRNTPLGSVLGDILAQQDRIGYDASVRLHQTMTQAARQAGLPLQSGPHCQLAAPTAGEVAELSKGLRDGGLVTTPGVPLTSGSADGMDSFAAGESAVREKKKAIENWCDQRRVEQLSGTVPTLTQMLQIEDEETRLVLVRELTRIKSNTATAELARRAIMDLSPTVRRAALVSLERRPWWQYAPILVQGLRYPWPPVADHAAVALRALKPTEAVAPLVDLLDLPSPSQPILDARTNQYAVREVVRLNHLRNCLLCHEPCMNKDDGGVTGLVPTPGTRLPAATATGGNYYSADRGDFVRADITYLRQDFSLVLPEETTSAWPRRQRYDFVTRLRTLSPTESANPSAASLPYPQREAVTYALRGITGKDGGDSSAKWRDLLGIAQSKPQLDKITTRKE